MVKICCLYDDKNIKEDVDNLYVKIIESHDINRISKVKYIITREKTEKLYMTSDKKLKTVDDFFKLYQNTTNKINIDQTINIEKNSTITNKKVKNSRQMTLKNMFSVKNKKK